MAMEAKSDPAWRAARRWGRRAAGHRMTEFAQAHGGELSSGICALLADAWDMRADARYLQARAARDDNPDLLRLAAQLLTSARQAERDAWELASRESRVREETAGADLRQRQAAFQAQLAARQAQALPASVDDADSSPQHSQDAGSSDGADQGRDPGASRSDRAVDGDSA